MTVVTLLSGGLDSALMATLIKQEGIGQLLLFVHYGQLSAARELESARRVAARLQLEGPATLDLRHYGRFFPSGLTDPRKDAFLDAFLPGRNMLLILGAASFAYQQRAEGIAMGLLAEATTLFPDQSERFLDTARNALSEAFGRPFHLLLPLRQFTKADVVRASGALGITRTYSCHRGGEVPCNQCIACREYQDVEG